MRGLYKSDGTYVPIDFPASRWKDKTIVFFGDSRTWYDGNAYVSTAKDEWVGKICKGYQQIVADLLLCTVVNRGVSGNTSVDISTRIRNFDFSNVDAVFLEGGVNDFIKSSEITIGEIAPIGSTFNTNTVYGAWQSAVEYILNNYPQVKIFIDVPAIAWSGGNVFPYEIAKIKAEIAELYNLPCLDLYKNAGLNILNRNYYYVDDTTKTSSWYLHFNDYGNKYIGEMVAGFINNK